MAENQEPGTSYVNQDTTPGGDPRIGGRLGAVLGRTQRALSVNSPTPPKVAKKAFAGGGHVALSWSRGTRAPLPFVSLFIPLGNGRFWSWRAGWRWDPYSGDGRNPNEPARAQPGTYIADVIFKADIDNEVMP